MNPQFCLVEQLPFLQPVDSTGTMDAGTDRDSDHSVQLDGRVLAAWFGRIARFKELAA